MSFKLNKRCRRSQFLRRDDWNETRHHNDSVNTASGEQVSVMEAPSAGASPGATKAAPRLQSLDVLRGLTVAIMIMVNTKGDGAHTYRFLVHSRWNGCTLVMLSSCFRFITEFRVSSPSAVASLRASCNASCRHAEPPSFPLGLLVNSFPTFPIHSLRVFGVAAANCPVLPLLMTVPSPPGTRTFDPRLRYPRRILDILRWVPVPGLGIPHRYPIYPFANLPALDRHLLPVQGTCTIRVSMTRKVCWSSVSAVASTLSAGGQHSRQKNSFSDGARVDACGGCFSLGSANFWSYWFR